MEMLQPFAIPVGALVVLALVAIAIRGALVSARTPQGAAAWVVFLLAAPWFALPAYLIFGSHKLRRYERARQRSRSVTQNIEMLGQDHRAEPRADGLYVPFERLADLPVLDGNAARLLIDGAATFEAIFAAIDAAERYVCVQFYTIVDDDLGGQMAEHLIAAAARGVAIRVIYDGVGSYSLAASYRDRLSAAGITILDPKVARGPTKRFEVNFRNHRKTVVVDGWVGFLGGHNVSDLYLGKDAPGGAWRDTHLELRGPAVVQLQLTFFEDWHWATGERLDTALDWNAAVQPEDLPVLILPSGPSDTLDTAAMFFFAAISRARSRVWIATPYFVPDEALLSALKSAAMRGCDVRLLVPEKADHVVTWLAAFAYFDEVRAAGVKVYNYGAGFLHEKVVLMDDDMAAVGTANFDNRSFRLNFETMALVFDAGFAGKVAAMLTDDLQASVPLERDLRDQPLGIRMGAPFARLLAPVL